MVKPILSIKLKESHSYFSQDETIPCIVNFKLEKVLKEGFIRIQFMGRSSSYCNGSRQHLQNIFTVEKEIKIEKWNNSSNIKKMHETEFSVEVPNGKAIPSYRNLEGSDGGKIEYMIEASLETPGGLFKKSNILANHIIQVPLIAKVNINDDGLERHRESSIRWPKIEENVNTSILLARIPHEGCIRGKCKVELIGMDTGVIWILGKEVPVRVNFQQPERFDAIKFVKISLIQQEIIASSKDNIPEMTKQLADRIITTEEKPVTMIKDIYNPLLIMCDLIMVTIPSNATPTIGAIAKVMRIDYKIRVTVNITGAENGKEKELSVNLPIVVGTAGEYAIVHDSGVDTKFHNSEVNSINSPVGYSPFNGYPPVYPNDNMSFGSNAPYPPPTAGGFQMPNPYHATQQPYPPQDRFMLNPQKMSYSSSNNDSKFEGGMPVPEFSTSEQIFSTATSPINDQTKPFVYPPVSLKSQMSTLSVSTNPFSANADNSPYSLNMTDKPPGSTPTDMSFSPVYEKKTDADTAASLLSRESTRSTTHSTGSNILYPPNLLSIDKPNTPTPPQTPAVINRNLQQQRPQRPIESGSSYYSGVSAFDDSVYSSSPPQGNQIATRIGPLEGTIVLSNIACSSSNSSK